MTALFKKDKKTDKKVTAKPVVSDTPATPSDEKVQFSVIKGLYVSEKATKAKEAGQYVFEVIRKATRPEIKKELQKKYGVNVVKINILNRVPKKVTVGRYEGSRSGLRKAMVTLKKGQTIPE